MQTSSLHPNSVKSVLQRSEKQIQEIQAEERYKMNKDKVMELAKNLKEREEAIPEKEELLERLKSLKEKEKEIKQKEDELRNAFFKILNSGNNQQGRGGHGGHRRGCGYRYQLYRNY